MNIYEKMPPTKCRERTRTWSLLAEASVFTGLWALLLYNSAANACWHFSDSYSFIAESYFIVLLLTLTTRTVCGAGSVKRSSVRLSICLSNRSTATAACGGFAAERPAAGDIDRQSALSSKCGQRHVDSRRRRLNRNLFFGGRYGLSAYSSFHALQRRRNVGAIVQRVRSTRAAMP